MNNPVAAEENLYFEMETKDGTDAGVYDDVEAPGAKQLPLEKQGAENSRRASTEPAHSCRKSDAVIVQRLLCMMTAVIIFCVLIAATTLVLALTAMSRNTSAADCTVVQERVTSTPSDAAFTELSKDVQNLKENITSVKENSENTTALWENLMQKVIQLDQKVINISNTQGPPGYNGTQGPPGVAGPPGSRRYNGSQGPPGGSGSGGLTQCSYKESKGSSVSAGAYAKADVTVTEPSGKTFIGANCGTNDAMLTTLSRDTSGPSIKYKCACANTLSSGAGNMYCVIHYWECQV